jgi:hypothetical protein
MSTSSPAAASSCRGWARARSSKRRANTEVVEVYRDTPTLIKHLLKCLPAGVDPKLLF